MKGKRFAALLLTAMVAAGSVAAVTAPAVGAATTKESKVYYDYMEKHFAVGEEYMNSYYIEFDLNGDGVKELFFTYDNGARRAVKIFTYQNGKVKGLKTLTGVAYVTYHKTKHRICVVQPWSYADIRYTTYEMQQNGTLKKIRTDGMYYVSEEYAQYFANGKPVTGAAARTVRSRITAVNRWKVLNPTKQLIVG